MNVDYDPIFRYLRGSIQDGLKEYFQHGIIQRRHMPGAHDNQKMGGSIIRKENPVVSTVPRVTLSMRFLKVKKLCPAFLRNTKEVKG